MQGRIGATHGFGANMHVVEGIITCSACLLSVAARSVFKTHTFFGSRLVGGILRTFGFFNLSVWKANEVACLYVCLFTDAAGVDSSVGDDMLP